MVNRWFACLRGWLAACSVDCLLVWLRRGGGSLAPTQGPCDSCAYPGLGAPKQARIRVRARSRGLLGKAPLWRKLRARAPPSAQASWLLLVWLLTVLLVCARLVGACLLACLLHVVLCPFASCLLCWWLLGCCACGADCFLLACLRKRLFVSFCVHVWLFGFVVLLVFLVGWVFACVFGWLFLCLLW